MIATFLYCQITLEVLQVAPLPWLGLAKCLGMGETRMGLARVIRAAHFSSSCLSSPLGPEASMGLFISCGYIEQKCQWKHSSTCTAAPPLLMLHGSCAHRRAWEFHGTVQGYWEDEDLG